MRFRQTQSDLASARLAARSGRPDEAMRLYEAAIATSPESAFLYRELGVVERQLDNADSALGHFRTAIALDPTDAASHVEIAELLERRDDVDAALLAYDAALAIEPNASVESRREALRARAELAGLPEEFRAIETLQEISRAHLAALIGVRLGTVLQEGRPGGAVVLTDVRSSWAEPWIMSVAGAGVSGAVRQPHVPAGGTRSPDRYSAGRKSRAPTSCPRGAASGMARGASDLQRPDAKPSGLSSGVGGGGRGSSGGDSRWQLPAFPGRRGSGGCRGD